MKYVKEKYAFNQNIKTNHTKKYQHNMNIISFLKSNYKYKRRCIIRGCCFRRCQQQKQLVWRQQQTHPLPAGGDSLSDHRSKKMNYMCTTRRATTKGSKFPRIFIIIMQPTTTACAPSAIASGLIGPLVWCTKRTTMMIRVVAAANHRASHACKDANKDTNIASDSHNNISAFQTSSSSSNCNSNSNSNSHHGGGGDDEMHYQHGNYDKVSTITSMPPLGNHRQMHDQTQSSMATKFVSPFPTLLSSLPLVHPTANTGWYCGILHHDINAYTECGCGADDDNSDNRSVQQSVTTVTVLRQSSRHSSNYWCLTKDTRHSSSNASYGHTFLKPPLKATSCQSDDQHVSSVACNRNYKSSLLLTLFIALAIGVRTTTAGACWQTVLGSGKCNDIFSFNMTKSECCGANQEFAYTDREPTSVEYFFATAIGGGMECTPCLESCRNVMCGPNKKCVKRKGRPKCVCAPECGAARRRRLQREQQLFQQHHSAFMVEGGGEAVPEDERIDSMALKKTARERSRQSRGTRSLSSEITTKQVNVGPERQTQNQRKYIHIHMQQDYAHQQEAPPPKRKKQQPKGNRRLLLTSNIEHTEKPTTRRIQLFSNVRTTFARRHFGNNKNNARHEDSDPSDDDEEDYEAREEYDDLSAGAEDSRSKSTSNSNSNDDNDNDNNRNDDATRFLNQSLSRHKSKSNKNMHDHDLQTAKIQEQTQYYDHSTKSHTRQSQQNGRHAENSPNQQSPPHRQRHQHHHYEKEHDHNRHMHEHRPDHEPHHQQQHQHQHHNNHQQSPNHNRNENHGRHKHNKQQQQQQHKERSNVQKYPKNHKDFNLSTSTTDITSLKSTSTSIVSRPNKASVLYMTSTPTSFSKASQPQFPLQPPTTPVNSTASAGAGAGAVAADQSRYGSKISTSSKQPSFSSPTWLSASAMHHSNMPSTSLTMSTAYSTSSSMGHVKVEGVSHQPYNRDHNAKLKTTPPVVAASTTTTSTTNSYNDNDNDNTISTLHTETFHPSTYRQHHHTHHNQQQQQQQNYVGVLPESYNDQFDLHEFPKMHHEITITDSLRSSNPVCGTDGRTYNTECQLRKRACRTDNPNLQVAYRGHCKTTCNGVKCMNGLSCVEDQYTMPHCIACKIECPMDDYDNGNNVVDASRAVCGADGKTYRSMCEINRIICSIGRSIGVAYPGPCRGNQITCDDINCGSKQICLIDLMTHQPRCTPCRYKCSRKHRPTSLRFEEDKICGVNNRTYNSWCEMRKDSCSTGFYIEVKHPGHCH